MKRIAALAVALLTVSLFASCIGSRSKSATLFPAAELSWPAVQEDYLRGVADGVEDGELVEPAAASLRSSGDKLGAALTARDVSTLRTISWPSMAPWAQRGIEDKLQDGEIGPGVRLSLLEQVANFTTTITKLQGIF